jgi:hypothetical protein
MTYLGVCVGDWHFYGIADRLAELDRVVKILHESIPTKREVLRRVGESVNVRAGHGETRAEHAAAFISR